MKIRCFVFLLLMLLFAQLPMFSQSESKQVSKIYGNESIYIHSSDGSGNRKVTNQDSILSVNYKEAAGYKKFLSVKYENTTQDAYVPDFNFWATEFKNINLPYSTKSNNVVRFGFNTGAGGGRIDPNEHDLHIAFENRYYPSVNILGISPGHEFWEWHLQSMDKSGSVHRPITMIGSTTGLAAGIGLDVDEIYMSSYKTGQQWFRFNRSQKQMQFIDTSTILFESIQDNIPFVKFFTGVRYWDVLSASGNQTVINRQNNDLRIDAIKIYLPYLPAVTGTTSANAESNAGAAGLTTGALYRWFDDLGASHLMIKS